MRIGIVGGIERNEREYRDIAERHGHEVAFHSGHVGGRGSTSLVDMVAAVDLVIVLTDVNSHGAVTLARRTARRRGRRVELHRRYSPSRLASLVAAIPAGGP
ncbi:MAG: DUF2325 domain-containing protein [Labilithrix sp.]|nr:DUF2325 domain-containing protein [Labilithrix sp.]